MLLCVHGAEQGETLYGTVHLALSPSAPHAHPLSVLFLSHLSFLLLTLVKCTQFQGFSAETFKPPLSLYWHTVTSKWSSLALCLSSILLSPRSVFL